MDGVISDSRNASGAKNASAINQRRTQKSTTLNRRFVKRPGAVAAQAQPKVQTATQAPLRSQSGERIMIRKTSGVRLAPIAKKVAVKADAQQQGEKVVQKAVQQKATAPAPARRQPATLQQTQQKIASRASARAISLKDLASIRAVEETPDVPAVEPKVVKQAKAKLAARKAPAAAQQLSAQELKERAIQQALQRVATMEEDTPKKAKKSGKKHLFKKKKFALAAVAAVISLVVLGYLVSVNLPDISVRVAAMHSGIEKAYPSYVPASYRLDGLVKEENGRITMAFKNDRGQKFTLMEEKSSWDSSAVLTNYVLKNWGASYSIAKGQGLTIYVSDSNAAWVNGGVFYVITDEGNSLTSSDLHDIAISL